MTVRDAKVRIGDVWQLGRLLNWPLSGRRQDFAFWRGSHRTPSVSLTPDGQRWHDFATGEKGDLVDLLARVEGLSKSEACRRVIALAGGSAGEPPPLRPVVSTPARSWDDAAREKRERWPEAFPPLHRSDVYAIAHQRNLPTFEGVAAAVRRGVLVEVSARDDGPYPHRAWALTDSSRNAVQMRRLDGRPWACGKSKSLAGSMGGWPIGIAEAGDRRELVLTEGEPDLLAALSLHCLLHPGADGTPADPRTFGFCCLTGGAKRIAAAALPLFAGRHVRLVPHRDSTGNSSVDTWGGQLAEAGATVSVFRLDGLLNDAGQPAKDLNEVVTSDGCAARLPALARLFATTEGEARALSQ